MAQKKYYLVLVKREEDRDGTYRLIIPGKDIPGQASTIVLDNKGKVFITTGEDEVFGKIPFDLEENDFIDLIYQMDAFAIGHPFRKTLESIISQCIKLVLAKNKK